MAKLKTAVTERLGIEYPIIQGCMQWIAYAPLAAAVSKAGGLGIISSSSCATAEDLRAEVKKIREITDKPFAVNITNLPSSFVPDFPGYVRVCVEEKVPIIETAGLLLKPELLQQIKDAGIIWIHKCTILKHALKAQSAGCDMIVADGFECAGHPGENDIGTMVLTPTFVEKLNVPVIAAGGISTGRQMAAAIALGADGVYMGTRFLLTKECPVLDSVKNYIAEKVSEYDTALLLRSYKNTTRTYASQNVKDVLAKEKQGVPFSEVQPQVCGAKNSEMFYQTGDIEGTGYICVGETVGLVHSVEPIEDVINGMMAEYYATVDRLAK